MSTETRVNPPYKPGRDPLALFAGIAAKDNRGACDLIRKRWRSLFGPGSAAPGPAAPGPAAPGPAAPGPAAAACLECKTTGGHTPKTHGHPSRIHGYCRTCYERRRRELRVKRREAAGA